MSLAHGVRRVHPAVYHAPMSSRRERATHVAAVAAGAAAGAMVAYYLVSRPAVRRLAWIAFKLTMTTGLPAVLVNALAAELGETPSAPPRRAPAVRG